MERISSRVPAASRAAAQQIPLDCTVTARKSADGFTGAAVLRATVPLRAVLLDRCELSFAAAPKMDSRYLIMAYLP